MDGGTAHPRSRLSRRAAALANIALAAVLLIACAAQPVVTPTPDVVATAQAVATQAAAAATVAAARLTLTAAASTSEPTQTASPVPVASPTPTVASTPTPTATPLPAEFTVTGGTINVRAGPGTSYDRIGELHNGETRRITGRNAGGDWWQFAFDGQAGWVYGDFVAIRGDVGAAPVVTPLPTPSVRCFAPRLRDYVEHKGCCGEIVGEVRDRYGQPFAAGQIEVTIPGTSYRTPWPLAPGGDYSITALDSRNPYTVRLIGVRVGSSAYEIRYPYQRERAVVDFFEADCSR